MKKNSDLNKFEKRADKATEIIASVGMATSLSSFLTLIPSINNDLGIITGGTILLSPCVYFGMNYLKEKAKDRQLRDMHHASQLFLMMREGNNADHNVTKSSTLFLHELHQEMNNYDTKIDDNEQMNINQFLYLINANYYDEIIKTFPMLNREEIVRRLIIVILNHLTDNNKTTFDENDAKEVLGKTIFIKQELKEQIYKEFKKSKVKFGKNKFYEIIRNDTDSSPAAYEELRRQDEMNQAPNFDIEDLNQIYSLIGCYVNNEMMQELGNTMLDWDYDFLRRLLVLISTKYRRQLIDEHGTRHNNLNLTSSFIYNAISYAVVNEREMVGYKEMINAFKNWDYIPFNLQLEILDDLFEQEEISYEEHPYGLKKPKKNKPKIIRIEFNRNNQN